MMQFTSLKAWYGEVVDTLGDRHKAVLDAFMRHPNFTNSELADFLQWPINTVTPRVNELRKKDLLKQHSVRYCRVTGRLAKVWCAVGKAEEKRSNPLTDMKKLVVRNLTLVI